MIYFFNDEKKTCVINRPNLMYLINYIFKKFYNCYAIKVNVC